VPILPLIDLLILLATGSLFVGFVLKAIAITTRYSPSILGFSSLDFVIITGICMGLALVLAARSWVKLNESEIRSRRSRSIVGGSRRLPEPLEDLESEEQRAFEAAEQARARMR